MGKRVEDIGKTTKKVACEVLRRREESRARKNLYVLGKWDASGPGF